MLEGLLLDLDGTVYRGSEAIPGAADFIASLRIPYLFVTNRGNRTPMAIAEQLRAMGIACSTDSVLTSSQATAQYVGGGQRVFCIGEEGLKTALREVGAEIVDGTGQADVVVVSFDRRFDYDKLNRAMRLIEGGARFVATNDDRAITVETGLVAEAGPLVAAVATATQRTPEIVGKPHAPILRTALERLRIRASSAAMVGDNVRTDVLAGQNAGMLTALILTGVSDRSESVRLGITPTWIAEDYDDLARQLFQDTG